MGIRVSEQAAQHLRSQVFKDIEQDFLRFGVKASGCSGFSYFIELGKQVNEDDQVFDSHGVKVVIDKQSLELVDGTEIDYVQDDLSALFKFNNPKVTASCGCGESFTINDEV